jgi:hypothetical protein
MPPCDEEPCCWELCEYSVRIGRQVVGGVQEIEEVSYLRRLRCMKEER